MNQIMCVFSDVEVVFSSYLTTNELFTFLNNKHLSSGSLALAKLSGVMISPTRTNARSSE